MADAKKRLEKKLYRAMKATTEQYQLLAEGDRVMVAVSGGKDSYTLLHLLHMLRPRLPFPVELIAVHLDQVQPGYDGAPLEAWLEESGYPFEILREDTYSVVTEHIDAKSTYCSLCSRLRRGILYTAAERLGCNKIALGHHRDDSIETFLMNTFFSGKLQAMPAKYTTDDGRFQVIRPLIECPEDRIATFSEHMAFPILPCNLCGSQEGLKREQMKAMLSAMEEKHPDIRNVMLQSLRNVRPTHLLDQDVLAAWDARPAEIRPKEPPRATTQHADAKPRLTVLS